MFHHQLGITVYLQLISFHGVGKIKPNYDSFVLSLVIGGLKSESKCVFHVNHVQGGQNQTRTASLGIYGPIYRQPPEGFIEVFEGVNSMMKSAKTRPLTAVLGLYMMLNSVSPMTHFISLPEVSGLCNIYFIGCYVGISIM